MKEKLKQKESEGGMEPGSRYWLNNQECIVLLAIPKSADPAKFEGVLDEAMTRFLKPFAPKAVQRPQRVTSLNGMKPLKEETFVVALLPIDLIHWVARLRRVFRAQLTASPTTDYDVI